MSRQNPILLHYKPSYHHTNYGQKSESRTSRKNGIHGHRGVASWRKEACRLRESGDLEAGVQMRVSGLGLKELGLWGSARLRSGAGI